MVDALKEHIRKLRQGASCRGRESIEVGPLRSFDFKLFKWFLGFISLFLDDYRLMSLLLGHPQSHLPGLLLLGSRSRGVWMFRRRFPLHHLRILSWILRSGSYSTILSLSSHT